MSIYASEQAVIGYPAKDSSAEHLPSVALQIRRATEQAEIFRRHLEELQKRLSPVMGHDTPQIANRVDDNVKAQVTCPLADQIQHIAETINGGNLMLANILKRLEI
jgi:hypothetical protein